MRQGSDRPDISERLNGSHAESDYDALADLFLGDSPATPAVVVTPPRQPPSVQSDANAHADLGMPHGPCCSRVGPIGGAATAKPVARRVDVLVLGSLPGLGGTWATQHARATAIQLGAPACFLRLSGGQLVIDLIWPDDARPVAFPACDDAAGALRLAAQHAGAWLLRVQGADEGVLDEWLAQPAAANSPDPMVDRVRLLTGADDPAIIAAYGRLKAWHAASPHGFARLARVTIVEPDAARAATAESRLRKAAASFLETQLAPAERLGAMRPVRLTTLYCGPFELGAREALALIRKVSAEVPQGAQTGSVAAGHIAASAHTEPAGQAVPATISQGVAQAAPGSTLAGQASIEPGQNAAVAKNGTTHPTSSSNAAPKAATNGVHPEPAPLRVATTTHASHAPRPVHTPTTDQIIAMIARSAGIDTLRAAPTNCPWSPAIVLAVDQQGEAHAIAFAQDEAHVPLAAVDLLTASRWCAEHASLLAMAGITPRANDTTLHLITTVPAAARRLADTGLRVHAAVRMGESWGAVALS